MDTDKQNKKRTTAQTLALCAAVTESKTPRLPAQPQVRQALSSGRTAAARPQAVAERTPIPSRAWVHSERVSLSGMSHAPDLAAGHLLSSPPGACIKRVLAGCGILERPRTTTTRITQVFAESHDANHACHKLGKAVWISWASKLCLLRPVQLGRVAVEHKPSMLSSMLCESVVVCVRACVCVCVRKFACVCSGC